MYQFLNCYQFMEVPQALVSSIKVHLLYKNNLNYLTRWNIPPSVNCNKVILIIETSACGKCQIFILFFRHMTQYDSVTFFSMVNSVKWVFCDLKKKMNFDMFYANFDFQISICTDFMYVFLTAEQMKRPLGRTLAGCFWMQQTAYLW